jgi:phosphatidylglycerophosphate synthase
MTTASLAGTATHTRENHGVLADLEKRTLIWIARRLPSRINSDHLSALGLAAMFGTGVSFAAFLVTPWAAAGVILSLILNWFGDSLDGTLARVRGHLRPRYGYYVDHVVDLAGISVLMAGLASSGLMSTLLAVIFLAAYLLVSAETFLATHSCGVFRMSALGIGPTELRVLLAIGALRAAVEPTVGIGPVELKFFDVGGVIAAIGLVGIFVVSAIRNGTRLYREEPIPR